MATVWRWSVLAISPQKLINAFAYLSYDLKRLWPLHNSRDRSLSSGVPRED